MEKLVPTVLKIGSLIDFAHTLLPAHLPLSNSWFEAFMKTAVILEILVVQKCMILMFTHIEKGFILRFKSILGPRNMKMIMAKFK